MTDLPELPEGSFVELTHDGFLVEPDELPGRRAMAWFLAVGALVVVPVAIHDVLGRGPMASPPYVALAVAYVMLGPMNWPRRIVVRRDRVELIGIGRTVVELASIDRVVVRGAWLAVIRRDRRTHRLWIGSGLPSEVIEWTAQALTAAARSATTARGEPDTAARRALADLKRATRIPE